MANPPLLALLALELPRVHRPGAVLFGEAGGPA
jgi:hypothetical protein